MRPARFGILALMTLFGCTASVGGVGLDPDHEGDPGSGRSVGYHRLELLDGPAIAVSRGMQSTLDVRYLDPSGMPVADGTVTFEIQGDGLGSVVDAHAVRTGDDGRATVKVRAGQTDGTFDVVASASDADPVTFEVTVTQNGAGDLRVTMTYDGARRVHGADLYLYEGGDCEHIEADRPPPADMLQSVSSLRDAVVFDGLPTRSHWTTLALALSETGQVTAWGCAGPTDVVGGDQAAVEVPLVDLPIRSDGTWQLESHFDVGASLPPGVDSMFDAMAEMTDDPDDPATYFLDQLEGQIDNGALRFALSAARALTGFDRSLNDELLGLAPNFVWDALDAGGDLGRALQDMQIDSILVVGEPDSEGNVEASHQLVDLVLTLDGHTHRFSIANDVGIHDATTRNVPITIEGERTMRIGAHSVGLGVGQLTRFALNEVVLPRFDHSPHSLGEFIEGLIQCDDIGRWLADWVGFGSRGTWESVCGLGANMLGTYLEQRLLDIDDQYDAMSLEGEALAEDDDKDLGLDRLQDGTWTARWTGGAGELPVAGTFEGHD